MSILIRVSVCLLVVIHLNASLNDQLLDAVKADDIVKAEKLLKQGANPNAAYVDVIIKKRIRTKFLRTSLNEYDDFRYCIFDHPDIHRYYEGVIKNVPCLFFALDNENTAMITLLLRHYVNISAEITFEGQEIVVDTSEPNAPKTSITKLLITDIVAKVHSELKDLLNLHSHLIPRKTERKLVLF